MYILLIILAIIFWFFVLGMCASLAWDFAKMNRAFRFTFALMGVVLSGNMTFYLLLEGL